MQELKIPTKRGVLLDGVLFNDTHHADTVLIVITGIHGNFYSNPFYYNFGATLNQGNIDFIYAQTNDAFGEILTTNIKTGQDELIGSWNEDFAYTDEDIEGYLDFAQQQGYKHIIFAGHSLGANKVIYYLSRHHDKRVEHFVLLSPANVAHLTSVVTPHEKAFIKHWVETGRGQERLPFELLGWIPCTAQTAYGWVFNNVLDNVHVEPDGNFSQVANITHTGALLIGTYDTFTYGDPVGFLENINNHFPSPSQNKLIFIEKTGHTYQQKQQETAEKLLSLVQGWYPNNPG